MLRILSRYILREVVATFLVTLAVLTFMLPLVKMISFVKEGFPLLKIAQLTSYEAPYVLAWTLPLSLLIACVSAYGRMAADNEILAMRVSGVHPMRIVLPTIMLAACMVSGGIYLNANIIPNCRLFKKSAQFEMMLDIVSQMPVGMGDRIDLGQVSISYGHMEQGSLHDVVVHLRPKDEPAQIVQASRARIEYDRAEKVIRLTLIDAIVEEINRDGKFTSPQHIDEWPYPIFLDEARLDRLIPGWKDRPQTNLKRILSEGKVIPINAAADADKSDWPSLNAEIRLRIDVEINRRRAMAWSPLPFALIGIPLGLIARRGKRVVAYVLSLGVVLVFYPLLLGGNALASEGIVPAWAGLNACNVVIGVLGVFLLRRNVWRR